jgi:hypothetical protein
MDHDNGRTAWNPMLWTVADVAWLLSRAGG